MSSLVPQAIAVSSMFQTWRLSLSTKETKRVFGVSLVSCGLKETLTSGECFIYTMQRFAEALKELEQTIKRMIMEGLAASFMMR
ncbi:hypothetical protein DsansV1_C29g0206611 [Dioscorea sansibarensis]